MRRDNAGASRTAATSSPHAGDSPQYKSLTCRELAIMRCTQQSQPPATEGKVLNLATAFETRLR
jgi:hypothetical protein